MQAIIRWVNKVYESIGFGLKSLLYEGEYRQSKVSHKSDF
jgi:hypothetical protein